MGMICEPVNPIDSLIVVGEWWVHEATCYTSEDFATALLYPGKCWIPRNGHGPIQFPMPDPWLSHSEASQMSVEVPCANCQHTWSYLSILAQGHCKAVVLPNYDGLPSIDPNAGSVVGCCGTLPVSVPKRAKIERMCLAP